MPRTSQNPEEKFGRACIEWGSSSAPVEARADGLLTVYEAAHMGIEKDILPMCTRVDTSSPFSASRLVALTGHCVILSS
jgi:hypothetical protein